MNRVTGYKGSVCIGLTAVTDKILIRIHQGLIQCIGHCHCLDGRTRLISIIHAEITPDLVECIGHILIIHIRNLILRIAGYCQISRFIQIENRRVCHTKHLAVVRIHHQCRHILGTCLLHKFTDVLFSNSLDIDINGGYNSLAVMGFFCYLLKIHIIIEITIFSSVCT